MNTRRYFQSRPGMGADDSMTQMVMQQFAQYKQQLLDLATKKTAATSARETLRFKYAVVWKNKLDSILAAITQEISAMTRNTLNNELLAMWNVLAPKITQGIPMSDFQTGYNVSNYAGQAGPLSNFTLFTVDQIFKQPAPGYPDSLLYQTTRPYMDVGSMATISWNWSPGGQTGEPNPVGGTILTNAPWPITADYIATYYFQRVYYQIPGAPLVTEKVSDLLPNAQIIANLCAKNYGQGSLDDAIIEGYDILASLITPTITMVQTQYQMDDVQAQLDQFRIQYKPIIDVAEAAPVQAVVATTQPVKSNWGILAALAVGAVALAKGKS